MNFIKKFTGRKAIVLGIAGLIVILNKKLGLNLTKEELEIIIKIALAFAGFTAFEDFAHKLRNGKTKPVDPAPAPKPKKK